jgi:hypothetical protein
MGRHYLLLTFQPNTMLRRIYCFIGIWLYFININIVLGNDSLQQVANYKDSMLRIEFKQANYKLYQTFIQQQSAIQIHVDIGYTALNLGTPLQIELTDTAFRFICAENKNAEIHFASLTNHKLKIYNATNSIQSGGSLEVSRLKIGNIMISMSSDRQYSLNAIKNQFVKIQQLTNDIQFQINQFDVWIADYHNSTEKPVTTELQRRLIIQADAATKLYQYEKSIVLNNAIIQLHPTSYPSVYMNIAVLQAETNRLHAAIYNMKKYLLFKPNTTEETFAKTKINEWEIILNN